MLWYVLQTRTGGEEKLVEMIRRMVPRKLYGECFVIYHEQLWRRQQQTFIHVKRAFPGYVFITSKEAEALFFCLKKLPAMAKMMADEEAFFLSLDPEEAVFLQQMMDVRHVIGLSYLETDGEGKILQVSGPLSSCVSRIACCKFGKRYAIVRLKLLGKEKEVLLGIVLKEDICREIRYGKVEVPTYVLEKDKDEKVLKKYKYKNGKVSEKYTVGKDGAVLCEDARGQKIENTENRENIESNAHDSRFSVGDVVLVSDGTFQGLSGVVIQVRDNVIKMGIQFLGRMVEMEIPVDSVRKKTCDGKRG